MSNPERLPKDPMPVRTPGLADALRRLADHPLGSGRRRTMSTFSTVDRIEARTREAYSVVRRQARLFAAVFAGMALVLGLLVAFQTPVFESTALLLLKVGRELIYTPQVGEPSKAVSPSPRDKQTVINSELAIMRSEPVIASVVDTVGLASLYPDLGEQMTAETGDPDAARTTAVLRAKAGERLREALVVLALPDADVLQVSFRHPDADVAQKSVSVLIDRFTEAHLHAFGDPEVVRFLEERVEADRQALDTAEAAQREFELAHPVFAEDSPQAALARRLEELRKQIDEVDAQVNQVRLTSVGENSALAQAQRDRLALEVEASKLKGRLRETADRRVAVVKEFIGARRGEVEGHVAELQARRGQLKQQLTDAERERQNLPALASQYHDLRRERDAREEQFNTYQKHLQDARFSREMDTEKIASISVIQRATVTPEAIWPLPPALGIALVLLLSSITAGLAAILAEHYGWTWPAAWNRELVQDRFERVVAQARRR